MQPGLDAASYAGSAAVSPGYYIPDIHFEFTTTEQAWGWSVDGSVLITSITNIGGTTTSDPVNPSLSVNVSLRLASRLVSSTDSYIFPITGKDGFATPISS